MNEFIERAYNKLMNTKIKDIDKSLIIALNYRRLMQFSEDYLNCIK